MACELLDSIRSNERKYECKKPEEEPVCSSTLQGKVGTLDLQLLHEL